MARSLRPLEWFNLASIHGPIKFLLHDDFYDEDGVACEPAAEVEAPAQFPAPTLADVRDSPERLADFAMTRWSLKDDVIAALQGTEPAAVLASVVRRTEASHNEWIESRSYEICAHAVGALAADWIRGRYGVTPRLLVSWAQAASACLPFDEAFALTLAALDQSTNVRGDAISLGWFRTSRTLDWLESRLVGSDLPITEEWGRLAAISDFSWLRAREWLSRGRPLSLVALDAMNACWHYNTILLRRFQPKFATNGAALPEISRSLDDYAAKDAVPRVTRSVKAIESHLVELCVERGA